VSLFQTTQQQVFRRDFWASEPVRLVACVKYYPARFCRESFEHTWWETEAGSALLRTKCCPPYNKALEE